MSKKQYKIIFIWGVVTFTLFFIFYGMQKSASISESGLEKTEIPTQFISDKNKIAITIMAGDKTIPLTLHAGASLYDALLSAKNNGQIEFSGKNYPGLGFFVTDIGSLHDGNGKYLFYYINNKEASVGVSSYLLEDGDIVEWKLK